MKEIQQRCKYINFIFIDTANYRTVTKNTTVVSPDKQPAKSKLVTIHGNVMYDFFYQSHLDTPYAGNDLYQHTVTTYLDIRLKDKYPMRVYFTTHFSNGNYLKNISNINLQFNPQVFQNELREKLKAYAEKRIESSRLGELKAMLLSKQSELQNLKEWINSESVLQKMVEEREAEYRQQLIAKATNKADEKTDSLASKVIGYSHAVSKDSLQSSIAHVSDVFSKKKDSLNAIQKLAEEKGIAYSQQLENTAVKKIDKKTDSVPGKMLGYYNRFNKQDPWSFLKAGKQGASKQTDSSTRSKTKVEKITALYEKKRKKIDSLQAEIECIQEEYQEQSNSIAKFKNALVNNINTSKNPSALKELLLKNKMPDSLLPKGYKSLMAIRKLSIGTATLDYSELSAKNITVTGMQLEYNPGFYYAVAGGTINYRFRDYLLPQRHKDKQYLGLVRFGKETKNGNSLILTYYYGKKVLYNYYTTDSTQLSTRPAPNFNLMGITLENKIKLNEHSYLTGEIAKSSVPYYHSTIENKSLTGTFNFSDHSNEAYSVKINSEIPTTGTKLEGYFKHFGANFQSFTLLPTNSEQNAWLIKVNQELFKKQLSLVGSIRKNGFIDPFLNQRYVNNTVFKSIQATLRLHNLPIISAGFYPVSQVTKLNNDAYSENLFYTLTGAMSYFYNRKHTGMSTILTYMRFYNRPLDTGFVYYNTRNIQLSHSVFFKSVTLQSGLSRAVNNNYSLWAWDESAQWRCRQWLTIGGGIKYNKQSLLVNPQIGYQLNTTIRINNLGSFQLRMEKTFIPGINRELVANNIGRFTYYRTF